jgi:DAACS family dicarboxylate/amino acid:cation (Na+ or H+) symporter
MKQHHLLLISLVLGTLCGLTLHPLVGEAWAQQIITYVIDPIGQLFLRLIFMVVVPLVFSGLLLGIYQLAKEGKNLGKVATKTLVYTLLASSASVLIGITLANTIQPGAGMSPPAGMEQAQIAAIEKIKSNASSTKSVSQILIELVPKNPMDSAVRALDGEMIALMVFALIFGLALSKTCPSTLLDPKPNVLVQFFERTFDACMLIVNTVMKFAPIAVFCLIFSTSVKFGYEIILSLGLYVLTVVVGLLLQQFGVYSLLLKFIAKRSPLQFFSQCREVLMYAFATASSNATLPKTLLTATEKLKLSPDVSRFVLTVGSTANQNGTALFEGITVLFLAQVYHIDLTVAQQVQVVLMSILAGVGTAGVPGGSLPLIMILLQQLGIPAESIGIILGVDRFLDMCRTSINVSGDLVIAAMVDKNFATKSQPTNSKGI